MTSLRDLHLPPGARVVVAMSGGVDSSVTAALLAEAGLEVVGITLQLYDQGAAAGRKGACCAGQDIGDARAVAHAIGIPHYVLDMEARFKEAVIGDFVDAYAAGRTPVPCVRCNQTVKLTDLLAVARDLGAAALATGHYVRRVAGPAGAELHKAVDPAKDQSYFLFATTQAQLDYCRFPLGHLSKPETRAHAERLALPVARKPESQDICFVPKGHYSDIVSRLRPGAMMPGEIVHVDGQVLGAHRGVAGYTVGQRRGLELAHAEPLYVVRIEPESHRLVVGPRSAVQAVKATLVETSWLAGDAADGLSERRCALRLGHNEPEIAGRIRLESEARATVRFDEPAFAVAPGQGCVAYDGSRVLGGGFIARAATGESAASSDRAA